MDLILCRNVTMYFGQQTTRMVARRLLAAVTPGGWLLVGPSEPDAHAFAGFEAVSAHETTAYRRPQIQLESAEVGVRKPEFAGTRPAAVAIGDALDTVPGSAAERAFGPATPEAFLRAARIAGDAGRYAEARDLCCRALDLDPTAADVYQLLGMIYAGQQETELAVAAFRKAIYLERDFALAHHGLSTELRLLGDEAGAMRSAETARRLLRSQPTHWTLRGSHGITAQETRELLELYREGVPA
jgi:chemotaxis protein methyltransferase CheR